MARFFCFLAADPRLTARSVSTLRQPPAGPLRMRRAHPAPSVDLLDLSPGSLGPAYSSRPASLTASRGAFAVNRGNLSGSVDLAGSSRPSCLADLTHPTGA